jgi:Flp pilus assembly protein TadB
MSDGTQAKDPGAVWRGQPEETTAMNLEQMMKRRADELSSRTRWEILMSLGAALFFAGVMALPFAPGRGRFQEIGFAALLAWAVITVYRFRGRIWGGDSERADAVAVAGLEFYRKELERRRDHLRNEWVWHGPLFLAFLMLIPTLIGIAFPGVARVRSVLPLVVVLAAWTGFSVRRRYRQAKEFQREIEELKNLGTGG